MEQEILLRVRNLRVWYGGVRALDGADLSLDEGEIVALMGPNGAGKSTVLKAVFGLAPIHSGEVLWHGAPFTPVPHEVAGRGIAFVPQGRRVFAHLSVEENLEIGGFTVQDKQEVRRRVTEVMEFFPPLKQRRKAPSGALSGGEQQMLALARGLMTDPKVLLLDEPSLGLAPRIVKEVFAKIREINARHNTALFVVEHNIRSLLKIAHRAYILDKGVVVAQGTSSHIRESGVMEKIFLGKAH